MSVRKTKTNLKRLINRVNLTRVVKEVTRDMKDFCEEDRTMETLDTLVSNDYADCYNLKKKDIKNVIKVVANKLGL